MDHTPQFKLDHMLRTHPLMSYHGVTNWPPAWIPIGNKAIRSLRGEIGVLTHVRSDPQLPTRCYLVIEHDRQTYVGTLIFGNYAFCRDVIQLLRCYLSRSIKDIGDLDLSFTL